MFELPPKHPARALLAENDIEADDELILRRVQFADGRTRAFVNDQPVSVQALQALGAALVEIHGQHDDRALVDAATHRRLLDAFGGLDDEAAEVAPLWDARRDARGGASQSTAPRSSARSARPTGCAMRSRNCGKLSAGGRRGDRARRPPHRDDAGREGRRRSARRARRGRGPRIAGAGAGGGGAPAGTPRARRRRR